MYTKNNGYTKVNIIDVVVLIVILSYTGYLIMKYNGKFDFSGKSGIERLESNREHYNLQLILDGEVRTQWGMIDVAKSGDYLEVQFKNQKMISAITLTCSVCPELDVYLCDNNTNEWKYCVYSVDGNNLILKDTIATDRVRLVIADGYEETQWGIQEIDFVLVGE